MNLTLQTLKNEIRNMNAASKNDRRQIIKLENQIRQLHTFLREVEPHLSDELQTRTRIILLETRLP